MLSLLSLWFVAFSSVDPFFIKMTGTWVGQGEQVVNGQARVVTGTLKAKVENDQLVAHLIIAYPGSETATEEEQLFWARSQEDEGNYLVGLASSDLKTANATGVLNEGSFEITKNAGGDTADSARVRIRFAGEHLSYVETRSGLAQAGSRLEFRFVKSSGN